MTINILTVLYDSKSQTYSAPTHNPSREQARRSFSDAVNAVGCEKGQLFYHPEDFTLFAVGEFDHSTGEILPKTKEAIANGLDVKMDQFPRADLSRATAVDLSDLRDNSGR